MRIAIAGGGVFGVTAALELRRRGYEVTLFDAGPVPHPAASSTDVSKAVRIDYGSDRFYSELAAAAIEGWRRWNESWAEPPFREVGILMLSARPFDEPGFEAACWRELSERGVRLERLDATRLAQRFPAWRRSPYLDGYLNPGAGYVDSGRAMCRLRELALAVGVEIVEGRRCVGILQSGGRVFGIELEGGERFEAERVVVSAGAWTAHLLPELESFMWATGQPVVHLRPAEAAPFEGERFPVWCADIANSGRYGFPLTRQGLLKVGHHGAGRRYRAGEELIVMPHEAAGCESFARRLFPDLAAATLEATRLCLYCDTWDGDFLIDRHPARDGLVVAAGGSGHAFKFAPLLGEMIADALEGREARSGGRFRWRHPGQGRSEQARASG